MTENESSASSDVATEPSSAATASGRAALVATFVAIVVVAVVATAMVGWSQGKIKIPQDLADRTGEERGISLPPALQAEVDQAEYQVRLSNNGLAFGLIGLTFGAGFGFACGIAHRSFGFGLLAAGIGIVLGGTMGVLGGVLGQLYDEQFQVREKMDAFFPVLAMHAISLSAVAMATATAVAVGRRTGRQIPLLFVHTMIAVVIATSVFLMVSPLLSIQRTNLPIPEGTTNQAVWLGLLAALIGFTFYRNRPK